MFQAHSSDGIGYQSYLRRLRHLTIDSITDNQDQVRILVTEPNIFGENCEISEEKKDNIVIVNNEELHHKTPRVTKPIFKTFLN